MSSAAGDQRRRFEQLAAVEGREATDAVPAATVVLLRDGAGGPETLLVRRSSRLGFGAGAWVFPGGRVDPEDRRPDDDDDLAAARRAACREAMEEAALAVDEEGLVPFSFWVPPANVGKRFATWFFLGRATGAAVTVDGGEIVDHVWARPADVLERHATAEVELLPPTWITLEVLRRHPDVESALAAARAVPLETYATRFTRVGEAMVALYHGDAGYDDLDAERPGPRHRLWMAGQQWRYERDDLAAASSPNI